MTDLSLLQDFIMETGACLEEMESDLLHLQKEPDKRALLDNIFRSVYTVKSAAEYFGIEPVARLANEAEGLLNQIRPARPGITKATIDLLLAVRQRIGQLVAELEHEPGEPTKIDDLIEQIQTLKQDFSLNKAYSESTTVNEFDEMDFSDPNATASTYEEDDDELLGIFLEHLEKGLLDLQTQTTTLFTAGAAGGLDVLNDCLSIIDSLSSSANYMGYARLVSVYEKWTRKLQAIRELVENENQAFSPAAVENLMQDHFAVIAEIFPQLQLPETEASAAAIELPAPAKSDPQPGFAGAIREAFGTNDDSWDLLTAHAAEDSSMAAEPSPPTTASESPRSDKDLLARLSWSFDRQIARDPEAPEKSDSVEIEAELFSSSDQATAEPTSPDPEISVPVVDNDVAVAGPGPEIVDNLSAVFAEISPISTDDDRTETDDEELFSIFLEHMQTGLCDLRKQTELLQASTDNDHRIATLRTIPTRLNSLRASANYMGYRQLAALYDTWVKEIQATPDPLPADGKPAASTLIDRIRTNIVQLFDHFSQLEHGRKIKDQAATEKPTNPVPFAADPPTTTAPDSEPSPFAAGAEPSAAIEAPAIADLTMLQDFIVEAMEHLEEMENNLLRLDADPDGPEILNDIFRSIHTIKGAAEYLGIKRIAKLSHNLENLLYKLRQHDLAVNREVMDLLIAGRDRLNQLTDNLKQSQAEKTEINDLLERIRLLNQEKAGPQLSPTTANHAPETTVQPEVDSEQERPSLTEVEALLKAENSALLQGNDRRDPEKHSRRQTDQINEKKLKQSFRVEAGKIDELMNQVGELVVSRVGFNQLLRELREFQQEHRFDLREMKRLTGLTFRLNEATVLLGRVANELQESVMKVRMLPISQLFNRYPRLVFDLVRNVDKEVKLDIHGADTELDKMVIEEISDPLIHIIRNAVDHGIETTTERRKKGKPDIGTIRLEAYHEGNHVVVNIMDDGRGIDLNRVREKALAGRFASREELERMSNREITELIMKPGFSTAEIVTHISGRGVGMDVVRKNIEKLNGTIEIDTIPGIETRFRIKIPLTLAIIPALRVKVSGELFTIPLSTVKETFRLKPDAIATINSKEVITLRHHTLSLVRLAKLFKLKETRNDSRPAFVVVVSTGMKEVGLVVDALLGQEEVVIKPLEDYLQEKSGFSGATILGDGRISLILDVYELINLFMDRETGRRSARSTS
ncbi:MAG TPA: chemotaxis protein CheA [Proteobacteria bacterium]|nr:chemotaxis protein CheA [Pseudomonadota bacterium]